MAAVADHDTQRSVPEVTRRAAKRGIRIIPAVEVTTRWSGRQWHVLVYGIQPNRADAEAGAFRSVLADLDAQLLTLSEDARRRIEADGKPLPSLEEIAAGRPLWPYHVLMSAIREGHVKNLKEAAELVSRLGGGFSADEPLERVVDAAHQAGGIAVVAHPGRSDSVGALLPEDLDRMLAEVPIDGLEAHYRSHTDEQTALYRAARRREGASHRDRLRFARAAPAGEPPPLARHLGRRPPGASRHHRRAGSRGRGDLGARDGPFSAQAQTARGRRLWRYLWSRRQAG